MTSSLRQGGAVELDRPADAAAGDEDVGDDRVDPLATAEAAAGLGIVGAKLADHVGHVLVVDAADPLQRGEIALGEIVEIVDQPRHGRIVAVGVLRLEREAFGEVAGGDAGRVEGLDDGEDALDLGERDAEPLGELEQRRRGNSRSRRSAR